MCSFAVVTPSPNQSFLSTFWKSCCVTALTNCSSHSEEPARPLSAPGIRGTLSTPRFSLRDVSQLQQKRACPNTGCGPLCGKPIGLFTASHHVSASQQVTVCLVAAEQHPVTLHLLFSCCFDTHKVHMMTGTMCHPRLGHCRRPH